MSSHLSFIKPPALLPGDQVAVVAPAGPFDREAFEAGLEALGDRYRVRHSPGIFARHRYLAGDDARRLDEINAALAAPTVRGVFCARGGYGALRLLKGIVPLPAPGKLLVGFSDITVLHQLWQCRGQVSIHAPVLTQLGRQSADTRQRLFRLLEAPDPPPPLSATETYVDGEAEGRLLGGNLSMFSRLLGTDYLPPLDGAVLLLEDVGERPYRLDRMWQHLELAGVWRRVAGIALGTFTSCDDPEQGLGAAEVLRDLAQSTGLPCAAGFPIGHGAVNEAVSLGTRVRLDATRRQLTFLEAAVQTDTARCAQSSEP